MFVKRFIAITQRIYEHGDYKELRETLALDWGEFFRIYLPGYLPLPLSSALDFIDYKPYLCGVILSGGNDLYSCKKNSLSKQRDDFEYEIIHSCMRDSLPLLGICRGAQLLAEYFDSKISSCFNHVGTHKVIQIDEEKKKQSIYYSNSLIEDSSIKSLSFPNAHGIESDCFLANSFHNYGIKVLGDSLIPLAFSEDGFIEAFRHDGFPFYGLMWHIERSDGMHNQVLFKKWLQCIENYQNFKRNHEKGEK